MGGVRVGGWECGGCEGGRVRMRGRGCEGGRVRMWGGVRPACKGTPVPADPVNPLINSLLLSHSAMYSLCRRRRKYLHLYTALGASDS